MAAGCPLNNKGWWLEVSTEKTFSPVEAEKVAGILLLSDFPSSSHCAGRKAISS